MNTYSEKLSNFTCYSAYTRSVESAITRTILIMIFFVPLWVSKLVIYVLVFFSERMMIYVVKVYCLSN